MCQVLQVAFAFVFTLLYLKTRNATLHKKRYLYS